MTFDEQAKQALEIVCRIRNKCEEIVRIAEAVTLAVDGISLTNEQKQQIIQVYQNKKAQLVTLVGELP